MTIDVDAAEPATSPYLLGAYAPVEREVEAHDLAVTGELPAALQGAYLRNGPNAAFAPVGRYHVFDGDGMVHQVELRDGRATYRNRWVESAGLLAERAAGQALYGGLSDFRLPPPEVMATAGVPKNTANTHVIRHGGKVLALMEACLPTELTPQLDTVGEWTYDGALHGAMTAHPKVDPETGELVFFGYGITEPYLRYHVADATGRLTTSLELDLGRPSMMHDFAVSQTRVAFFDLPALFDLQALLGGGSAVRWEPESGARIGILDRADPGAGVRWISVDPFYVFHFLNAYDDGDVLVVEGCRSPRLNVAFGDDVLPETVVPTLHRWRIDVVTGTVAEEQLDDAAGDFPRINDDLAGRRTRYGYIAHARSWENDDVQIDGVTKHDLDAGTSRTLVFGPTSVAGESAFAPDPTRTDEDAGWLLNFVQDVATGQSDLVVVDAQGLDEVARVHLPQRVPFGFHGSWLADG